MTGNVLTANFRGNRKIITDPLWQWDYGQILRFTGITLPQTFEVHFANTDERGEAKTMIGTDYEVLIPDEYVTTGRNVFVWIYLHTGEDDGETEYKAQIPINKRAMPADDPPTPQEQSAITQAIAALNSAVVDVQEAVEAADDARASAASAGASATAAAASEAGVAEEADRASAAATAAESARGAAEAAQVGAVTAQTGAESARDEAAQASAAQIAQINATGAAVLESIPEDYTELSADVSNLKSAVTNLSKETLHELMPNGYQTGAYSTNGTITPNTGRAYKIYSGISNSSKLYFDETKWNVNYYYVNSESDLSFIYSPNKWDTSGEISFTYRDNATVVVVVKAASGSSNLSDRLTEIDNSIFVFKDTDKSLFYNGIVSGTALSQNKKLGIYSLGGFNAAPTSNMTDLPVSDFAGGMLVNTKAGNAGTAIRQDLIEIPTGTTMGRTFTRVNDANWVSPGYYNWVAYGDSITNGSYSTPEGDTFNGPTHGYAYRISKTIKRDKVLSFYNCGVRGIGWIDVGNNGETLDEMLELFTGDKDLINLVTIMLGINDYLSSMYIGDENSTEKDGTISGNVRYGLKWLAQNYKNARIVVISPINSTKHGTVSTSWSRFLNLTNPHTLNDVAMIIKYWCNYYGIRFIDELSEGFINTYNAESYLGDKLHPTDQGQWMLAYELAEKIGF